MEHFVRASNLLTPAGVALCAVTLLNGCSKAESQFAPTTASASVEARDHHHDGARPSTCTPKLWESFPIANEVYGYATPSAPAACIVLHGPYANLVLNSPIGLAIGHSPNWLYVADQLNSRIVVFDYSGNYVKSLNTTLGGVSYEPWSVCVSSLGTVGVASGNVEFFPPNAPSGSGPTGDATGVLDDAQWCAFDSAGNFFVDGTAGSVRKIAYLASSYVGSPGQTLVDSGLGSGSYWVGMYSRIDSPADQTLSVATAVGNSATQTVDTWNVTGPAPGPLTFTPCVCSPYTFTNYPSTTDPVYQVAPSTGGANGKLYIADFAKGIVRGPANGGNVTHKPGSYVVGVAIRPTGQY